MEDSPLQYKPVQVLGHRQFIYLFFYFKFLGSQNVFVLRIQSLPNLANHQNKVVCCTVNLKYKK